MMRGGVDLTDYLVRILIFLICAQTVIQLRPKKEYEKYFSYLVSLMVLLQLLLFLGNTFAITVDPKYYIEQVAEDIFEIECVFGEN